MGLRSLAICSGILAVLCTAQQYQQNQTQKQQYSAPIAPQYSAPVAPQYSAPVAPQYSAPVAPQYSAPVAQPYSAPAAPQYSAQVAPQYSPPVAAAPYQNRTAPYGNFTSRANYTGAPQYPPAYGASSMYGNSTGGAPYQQADPFAWRWDHTHERRKTYNQEAQNWIYGNIQQAWDFALNLVGGKNAYYNANQQCGYGGNPYSDEETRLQQQGETLVQTAQWLWDNYPGNKPDLHNAFINLDVKRIPFLADCLAEHYAPYEGTCDQYQRYSRPDQICNNIWFPTWGATNDIGIRITDIWNFSKGIWQKLVLNDWPNYDGTFSPLMNEKQVADLLDKSYQAECYQFDVTMMHAFFTQFITHDLIKSAPYTVTSAYGEQIKPQCCGVTPECYHHSCSSITAPGPSDGYGGYGPGYCMPMSDNVPAVDYCGPRAKDPRNLQTSYIDASQIYGATCEKASQLRSYKKGKLRVNKGLYGLYMRNINLPDDPKPDPSECDTNYPNNDMRCFLAGDKRANQHPGLTAYHALFLRLHNRLASSCARYLEKNYLPDAVLDEICYQEVRRIIQAAVQNMFYRDHLPVELGPYVASHPNYGLSLDYVLPYDANVHASVWPEYTYAAGRLHTVISHWAQMRDINKVKAGLQEPDSWYSIYEFLGKGYQLMNSKHKMNEILSNAIYDPEQCYDTSFVEELRGKGTNSYAAGMDMFTINIHRSREMGMPWYWQLRDFCGMSPVYDFYQAAGIWNQVCLDTLPQIYGHAKNVEGYIGLICELPLPGAIVGPTAACLLQRQYQNVREGDRWFFDRNGFTPEQMHVVKKFNMGKILCITTNLDYVTENVFKTPNPYTNKYQPCNVYDDITEDDLTVMWGYSPNTAGDYRTCKEYGAGYYASAAYQNATYSAPQYAPPPAAPTYAPPQPTYQAALPTYQAPQPPPYQAPPQPTYQAPPQPTYQAPPQPTYQAPPQPTYQAPPQPTYQAPPQPTYQAPPQPTYQAPPQPTYQAPPQPTYQAPPQPTYQAPPQPTYQAPPQPTYQAPPQPTYQAPPQPTYQAPPQPTYQAPPQPTYQAPPQPTYQAPPQPTYQAPPQPTYQAPSQPYQAPQTPYQPPEPTYQAPKPTYTAPQPQPYSAPKAAYAAPPAAKNYGNTSYPTPAPVTYQAAAQPVAYVAPVQTTVQKTSTYTETTYQAPTPPVYQAPKTYGG